MQSMGARDEAQGPSEVPVRCTRQNFLERVGAGYPHEVHGGTERLVQTVLDSLRSHITEGEWDDVKSTLPKDLVEIALSDAAARATPWTCPRDLRRRARRPGYEPVLHVVLPLRPPSRAVLRDHGKRRVAVCGTLDR